MATRNTTRTASKAKAQDAKVIIDKDQAFKNWQRANAELFEAYEVPTYRRTMCSLAASFVVGAGVGYVGGSLLGMLVAGAMTMTGSAFLSLLIYVIGLVMIIYTAFVTGARTAEYINSKRIDAHFNAIKTSVMDTLINVRAFIGMGVSHA